MHRVLIVSQQAEFLRQLLVEPLNLPVQAQPGAAQLWPALEQHLYQLLIIDLEWLPAADITVLRRRYPQLAVLLLADESARGQAVQHLELGATDYLLRPINPAELWLKTRRWLETVAAQASEANLHSQNVLQIVFDSVTDGIYILDKALTITAINQSEANRLGQRPEQLIGQSFLALPGPASAPELIAQIKMALDTKQEYTWLAPETPANNYFENKELRIYPFGGKFSPAGEQVLVFAQKVSERNRWQASLFRSANLAAVGQLAGSVAHQINNPLTVTMANSQLIMVDTDPNSEIYDLALGALKAGERIQKIVSNLLDFSNQDEYYFAEVDLVETIERALELVLRSLMKAGIKLEKDYQARPTILASVSQIKLVWVNLLLNARDAVANITRQPQIVIGTRLHSSQTVSITVTDNGIGLSPQHLKQVFTPFFTTKQANKALGLGLYSAQTIVEQHRGQISVQSRPGKTTTFEVVLPLLKPAA